jgi:hypothetical protein
MSTLMLPWWTAAPRARVLKIAPILPLSKG